MIQTALLHTCDMKHTVFWVVTPCSTERAQHIISSFNHRVSKERNQSKQVGNWALTKQHGITNQNTTLFIVTSLRSSNLSCNIKQAQNNEICNNSYMTVIQLPHSIFCIHSACALGQPPAKWGKTVLLLKLLFFFYPLGYFLPLDCSCSWSANFAMLPYAICQFSATCHDSSVHIQYIMYNIFRIFFQRMSTTVMCMLESPILTPATGLL